jgi:uncharacterized protein (DUF305 family)
MNTKFVGYSLAALLAGSTLTTFMISDRATAHDRAQVPTKPSNTPASEQRETGRRAEVDKTFLEMIVPHHQAAREMAEMAVKRAKRPEVKKFAQRVIEDQTREIREFQNLYQRLYGAQLPTSMNMSQGMNMSGGMGDSKMMAMHHQSMMNNDMKQMLQNASNFDEEFLRQIAQHHHMGIMMAGMVVDNAIRPETRKLASETIQSQNAELAQVQQLRRQARSQ